MASYVLLNDSDRVVHVFDAADNNAARAVLRTKCLQSRVRLVLARKVFLGTPIAPPTPPTVDETPVP
jgi:hypothetical protein